MSSILQPSFFDYLHDFGKNQQLKRLEDILALLDDQAIITALKYYRGQGRNDYPVEYLFRCFISFFFLGHKTMYSHLQEIQRNSELRWLIGGAMTSKAPSESAMSRFIKNLMKHLPLFEKEFKALVDSLGGHLKDFGASCALDSKILESAARTGSDKTPDGRRDVDASFTKKTYEGVDKKGRSWKVSKSFFGYKVHLLVDSNYELPLAYKVTPASKNDLPVGKKLISEYLEGETPLTKRMKILCADRGYDDEDFAKTLVEEGISPIIDMRRMWKEEKERPFDGRFENLYHTETGDLVCYCPNTGVKRSLIYDGYEKSRKAQRRKCPASAYGLSCKGSGQCAIPVVLRIPVMKDPRRYPPHARGGYQWSKLYKARTSVERVNSRLDSGLGISDKRVRSRKKQELFVAAGLLVMLANALVQMESFKSSGEKVDPKGLRGLRRAG